MKIEKTTLKNGARVVGAELPDYKSVTINFGFRTGSRTEPAELGGMSHYLEHMFFKGSKKRPSLKAIASEADAIGARYNASTSHEYTAYYIKTTKERFATALDIIGDMVTDPLLDQKELEKERGTIAEEISMYDDNPAFFISDLVLRTSYGDTGLGRPILGTKQTIKNVSTKNMRQYYLKHYNVKNLVVVAAGNLPDDYVGQISEYIGRLPDGQKTTWEPAKYAKKQVGLLTKESSQVNLAMTLPGVSLTSPDRHPLNVAASVLGGYMSSRLFSEIRDKRGWAYHVSATSENGSDSGLIEIYAGVKLDKTEESVRLIAGMIKDFSETITEAEVARAIGYLTGSSGIRLESTDQLANEIMYLTLMTGKAEDPEAEAAEISKVTIADVKRVATKYFDPTKAYVSVIGPFKDREKFAKILAE